MFCTEPSRSEGEGGERTRTHTQATALLCLFFLHSIVSSHKKLGLIPVFSNTPGHCFPNQPAKELILESETHYIYLAENIRSKIFIQW